MKNKPLVLGHRGYRKKFPENTLLAFSKAFEFGADGIECDIQKSADGVYYVFHDVELDRMTGYTGYVDTEDSVKISTLRIKGQSIPPIDEFLDSLPGQKLINIELKEETLNVKDSLAIIDKLNNKDLKNNILISSFKHELLPPFKKCGFRTGMLFETETLENHPLIQIFKVLWHRPWSINPPVNMFLKPLSLPMKILVSTAKFLKIEFAFWTVNSAEQYNAVKDFACAVITDDVESIIKLREIG